MDIFGLRWSNYMDRLKTAWKENIGENDHVIIPGDVSWATYIDQAEADFRYIDEMPGQKIISKGNHDYWWATLKKLNEFVINNGFKTISFLQNNSYDLGSCILCGTRGWKCPGDEEFGPEDRKIYQRELQRLELSVKLASNTRFEAVKPVIAALHFPPFNSRREPSEFVEILLKYNVAYCIYGHLHGEANKSCFEGTIGSTAFRNVSADYLSFVPYRIL
jgi:predicted phosphohydrolase